MEEVRVRTFLAEFSAQVDVIEEICDRLDQKLGYADQRGVGEETVESNGYMHAAQQRNVIATVVRYVVFPETGNQFE